MYWQGSFSQYFLKTLWWKLPFHSLCKERQIENEVGTCKIVRGKGNWPKQLNFGKGRHPQGITDMMLGSVREISYQKYFVLFILTYNQPTETTAFLKCSLHSNIACKSRVKYRTSGPCKSTELKTCLMWYALIKMWCRVCQGNRIFYSQFGTLSSFIFKALIEIVSFVWFW